MSLSVLVTGSTGFIGSSLLRALQSKGYSVRASVRNKAIDIAETVDQVIVGNLSSSTDWSEALSSVDVVVHLAARVHIMHDTAAEPLAQFREVNVNTTLNLAFQAAKLGVKRFIFISSIKVNGNNNSHPFTELDTFNPQEPYAISKYEAEQSLIALAEETSLELVIIRPPLVYGLNVLGNFDSLIRWVNKGVPMPFGAIYNQRSLIALDNLTNFIIHCIDHPKAVNQVFLISDDKDVSTTELLCKVAKAFGKKPILIPVPVWLMTLVAKLIGKSEVANRLFGSLQIDSSKARKLLNWQPIITMDEQLKKIADAYLDEKNF